MTNRIFSITGLFLFASLSLSLAQENKGELRVGEKVSFELAKEESHQFSIDLEKDQFALLKLSQRGIDVLITTFKPKGEEIETFDTPNGSNGPEYITIVSNTAGIYRLEVKPFDESQDPGLYDLEILKIEDKPVSEEGKVDQLFAIWDNDNTPGAAISIVKDGEILYKKGYGVSNLEYDIPVTPATIFHIASVSKQFTAFSILLLEQEGQLSLDDDIRLYIPEVPDFGKTITLRHLAHHTSGMRDQWNLLALAGWRLDDVITREQIFKLISNQQELNFSPGDEFLYCNTGFTLLAEVVARVSGKSFARFTKERIFEPLHMSSTLFYDDHEKIVPNRAYSYYQAGSEFKKSVLSYANVGATSLFTTVEDLSLWTSNFEDPVVGDETLIAKMNQRGVLNSGDTIGYALGQSVYKYRGADVIGHGGADAGYRTNIARFPAHGFSVIVFSNNGTFNPASMCLKVADIYLENELDPEEIVASESKEVVQDEISMDEDTLRSYQGDFELQPGFIIKITLQDGGLIAQATGQQNVKLEPVSNTEFKVVGVDATVSFHRDSTNQVSMLKLYQGGQILNAPRAEPFDTDSVDLSEFVGPYYSDELSTSYEFVIENGTLLAKHQRHSDIKLSPVKRDAFSGDTWFFGQADFVRNEDGSITECLISSGRVRNIKFRRQAE